MEYRIKINFKVGVTAQLGMVLLVNSCGLWEADGTCWVFSGEQGNRVRSEVHAGNVQERSQRYHAFYFTDFTLQFLGWFVTRPSLKQKNLLALRVYDGDDSQLHSDFTLKNKLAELLHLKMSSPF